MANLVELNFCLLKHKGARRLFLSVNFFREAYDNNNIKYNSVATLLVLFNISTAVVIIHNINIKIYFNYYNIIILYCYFNIITLYKIVQKSYNLQFTCR